MKKLFNDSITWIKGKIIQLFVMVTFGSIVYFVSHYDAIASVFTVIMGNVLIDYFWGFNIIAKKIVYEKKYKQQGKEFNSDYYDLYWGLNKSRLQLLLVIITVSLPISQKINLFGWNWEILLLVLGFGFWILVCSIGHNTNVFFQLINLKNECYSEYTLDEKSILSKLK